jgi:methionyl-tRNA formyltransferase
MRPRTLFMGTPDFAVPSLEATANACDVVAVVTQPDKPAGRGEALLPPKVKTRALALGLPVLQPPRLRDPAVQQELARLAPELIIVVAYGKILPKETLALPRLGCWNLHASLLPKYRGAAPIQWAVLRGETETGVCVMRMEEGLDTGPVLAVTKTPIGDDETADALFRRLAIQGAELLAATLPTLFDGTATPREQDHAAATLAPSLKKEDGRLSFAKPGREVHCHIRAMETWPGASVPTAKGPLRLFASTLLPLQGKPGEVLGLHGDRLVIACQTDAVAVGELQLPGKKRLPAKAFLSGHPLPKGTVLG